jgi:hypothetical protein
VRGNPLALWRGAAPSILKRLSPVGWLLTKFVAASLNSNRLFDVLVVLLITDMVNRKSSARREWTGPNEAKPGVRIKAPIITSVKWHWELRPPTKMWYRAISVDVDLPAVMVARPFSVHFSLRGLQYASNSWNHGDE